MTAQSFRHEVAFYDDSDTYLQRAIPFLRAGLEAEEEILVAVGPTKAELLRGELGPEAEAVRFEDIEDFGRNPARIIPVWRDFVDGQRSGAGFRGIGESVWSGRDEAEVDECQRHESLLNLAFDDGPAWSLLCLYDRAGLPDGALAAALYGHPLGAAGTDREGGPSPAWGNGGRPDPFAGELPARPDAAPELRFELTGLHELRGFVARAAATAGLSDERAEDAILAASEVAANSIAHGGGSGCANAWKADDALLFEARDRGRIEDPLVGRVRPAPTQEKGRGLWIANQLCDLVQIRSSETGTAVRLRVALD